MVQLSPLAVDSHKTTKMGKKKVPKKGNAVDTPAKPDVKTQKQAKNIPVKAALQTPKIKKEAVAKEAKSTPAAAALQTLKMKKKALAKEAKSTPKIAALRSPKTSKDEKETHKKEAKNTPNAAPQTLKNGTGSAKKSRKAKTPKQEQLDEDIEMASEGKAEVAPAESAIKAQPSAKKAASVKSASSKEAGKFCLFVRGLHYESEQDKVFKHFQQFGTVTRCSIPRNPAKSSQIKGFGFIEYKSQEAMDKALATAHTLDNRTLQITINKAEKVVAGKRKRDESQHPGGDKKRQMPQMPKFDHELFVAKLKYSTSSNSIQKHFSQFGEVINIGLPMKSKTDNKGFAFVAFKEASSIKKALAKPYQQIDSANIVLDVKKKPAAKEAAPRPNLSFPNELFVGGLDPSTEKATLVQHFSKYGKLVNVTLPWNKEDSRNKGFGFISFESAASLKEALEEDHEIDGKLIGIRTGKKAEEKDADAQEAKSKNLKAAPAMEKMEDNSEEDDEEVEGEEADSEIDNDEEVEGESDEAEDEADEEQEGDDEESDEEAEDDEDGDNASDDDDDDDDDDE